METAAAVAKAKAESKDKAKKAGGAPNGAVIYLGHIPYGFFEEQMQGYFSQFGTVTRLRLSRSPKVRSEPT